jgi:hypothetical protein
MGTAHGVQDVRGIPPAVDEGSENFTEVWDSDGLEGAVRPIVTSAPSILLASTGRIGTASSTPTFHLPAVQLLTAKKFLYQRSQRFPTATTRPPVQTREGIQERSMKHKMVRSHFHNVSLMIWFGISACRRLHPSCWPPDSKRKIYLARTRVSLSFVEGMRTT